MTTAEYGGVLLRALEQSSSIVVVTDTQGYIEYVNAMLCRLTGYARDELIGKHIRILKSELTPREKYADLWRNLNAGRDWQGDFHNRKKNGELYWETAVISPIHNENGVVERYLKVAEDVTARKLLESELETTRQRYDRVVRAMRGFMFTVVFADNKPERTIYYPNPEDVTGYTIADYKTNQRLWLDMIVSEDRPVVFRQIDTVCKERKTCSIQHRIIHRDGSIRWVRNVSVPTMDGHILASYDGLITDITDLKLVEAQRDRLLEELSYKAARDPLTGLYSRRAFQDELESIWDLCGQKNMPVGIAMIDIDHFKVLNDTYGHQAGDQVLLESARLINANVRTRDIVCRYGGDEMVVVMPFADYEVTGQVAERLLDAFRQHVFCRGMHDLHACVSMGAASGLPEAHPSETILMRADQALYRAKQTGRNRLCLSSPEPTHPFIAIGVRGSEAGRRDEPDRTVGGARGRILVVDDDEATCKVIQAMLKAAHFSVVTTTNPEEAYAIAEAENGAIDVALVDLRLGESNGLDVVRQLRILDPTMIGVIITGVATVEDTTAAMQYGVIDFIEKPVGATRLVPAMERAMQYRRILQENRAYQTHLENMVAERSEALSKALGDIRQSCLATVATLAGMFELHENKTGRHCKRVAKMAQLLARELMVDPEDLDVIAHGALLHDIGKISIPDSILVKRGPLTDEEWKVMRTHSQIGYDIVRASPFLEAIAEVIYEHHERFDGSGYPRGLKGSEIRLAARIFAVIDAYDAMCSERPYAPARSPDEAVAEIRQQSGRLFDPGVVEAFLRCQPRIEECRQNPD